MYIGTFSPVFANYKDRCEIGGRNNYSHRKDATPRSRMESRCGAGLSGSSDVLAESPVPDSRDLLAPRCVVYSNGLLTVIGSCGKMKTAISINFLSPRFSFLDNRTKQIVSQFDKDNLLYSHSISPDRR